MISVVIASKLGVIREGMKRILSPLNDIEVVGEVQRAQEVVLHNHAASAEIVVVAHPSSTDGLDYL